MLDPELFHFKFTFQENRRNFFIFIALCFVFTHYLLGNICRSPIAEAVFIDEVKKAGVESNWEIDSAAIGSVNISV